MKPSTNATDADEVQSHVDDDGEDGPIDGERICDGKISAIVTADDDDQREEIADVPNQHVPAQATFTNGDDRDNDAHGDDTNAPNHSDNSNDRLTLRAEVDILLRRVGKLIWDADCDALLVAKATLTGIVATLETKTPAVDADGQKIIDE